MRRSRALRPPRLVAQDATLSRWRSRVRIPLGVPSNSFSRNDNALSGEEPRPVDHRVVPRTIFTNPQVAVVGMTEGEAFAAGHRCWCNTFPMSLVPRAGAIRDTRGIVKMVADERTDAVLGVSMVGQSAGEVIHEATMALRFQAKLSDFADQLHSYPTMAGALKISAISRFENVEKLSCCAE